MRPVLAMTLAMARPRRSAAITPRPGADANGLLVKGESESLLSWIM